MPLSGVLPQKQKSAAPGVLIGQRHRSLVSSNSEQACPLWIVSISSIGSGSADTGFSRNCRSVGCAFRRDLVSAGFRAGPRTPALSRVRLRREILPITAFRLTPIVAAISRQDSPASKPLLRRARRSVVQVG